MIKANKFYTADFLPGRSWRIISIFGRKNPTNNIGKHSTEIKKKKNEHIQIYRLTTPKDKTKSSNVDKNVTSFISLNILLKTQLDRN